MDDTARERLRDRIQEESNSIWDDAAALQRILRDHLTEWPRERRALQSAVAAHIPQRIQDSSISSIALIHELTRSFGMTPQGAEWAVSAWHYALNGVLPDLSPEVVRKTVSAPETESSPLVATSDHGSKRATDVDAPPEAAFGFSVPVENLSWDATDAGPRMMPEDGDAVSPCMGSGEPTVADTATAADTAAVSNPNAVFDAITGDTNGQAFTPIGDRPDAFSVLDDDAGREPFAARVAPGLLGDCVSLENDAVPAPDGIHAVSARQGANPSQAPFDVENAPPAPAMETDPSNLSSGRRGIGKRGGLVGFVGFLVLALVLAFAFQSGRTRRPVAPAPPPLEPAASVAPPLEPDPKASVHNPLLVTEVGTVTEQRDIPYRTRREASRELAEGATRVQSPGEVGREEIVWTVSYAGDKEVSRTVASRKTLRPSVERVVLFGPRTPIVYHLKTVRTPIPYKTFTSSTKTQEGREGAREIVWRIGTKNGKIVSQSKIRERRIREPVARVVLLQNPNPVPPQVFNVPPPPRPPQKPKPPRNPDREEQQLFEREVRDYAGALGGWRIRFDSWTKQSGIRPADGMPDQRWQAAQREWRRRGGR